MAATRPLVRVFDVNAAPKAQISLPAVLSAPIRQDIVQFVHANLNKNNRQAYAVSEKAGHQTSAESWGTGRAVSRIPRVPGGGTHRAGQGAFGNMCRGGRMFNPTKTWRRWHRKVNLTQKRFAVASALAASAITALVQARGHKIDEIPEVPLVISNEAFQESKKTKQAVALLTQLAAYDDVMACKHARRLRAGKGKMRNRRYLSRRGPLVVHNEADPTKGFRNLPGVEIAHVSRLNLLDLAPGGHLGRFIIWTAGALEQLDAMYGNHAKVGSKRYPLPHAKMTNTDLERIFTSDEVRKYLRPKKTNKRALPVRPNPLTNFKALVKLNPYAEVQRRAAIVGRKRKLSKDHDKVTAKKAKRSHKDNQAFVKNMLAD